ncbi:MAG: gliding motility-associated C-terminal domain-containing protein [Bacteroidetes bacterium]|nr:gliding motility-associated C-terminal domain-containing protein [Bacteroidota bacterium]
MTKKIQFLFVVLFIGILSKSTFASHIAGGEITYNCLGNNQYEINLNLFVDCAGFNPGATQTVSFTSTCGGTATLTVNVTPQSTNGLEISQLCQAQLPQSTCSGGTLPGMWVFNYTGIVTLAPPCDTWTMSWQTCCRNNAVTNVTPNNSYIEATLNSGTAACNSSPSFTAQPIPYVCANQPVSYSYGVIENDGDSLFYSIVPALENSGLPCTYIAPYTGTSPIPGIFIDPNTGLLTFTPTTIGNFVVAVLVQEYDSNGNLVGSVMRDIQFVVQNCPNQVPDPTTGTMFGFTGNAVQTGPYALEMCAGNSFSFNATYNDPDATNILTYISNIQLALPGAVITQVGASTNPLTLNISWTAPAGTQGQNLTFTITMQDGACPVQGIQTYVYNVNILDATTVNPDLTICGSQTAQLNAYGGSIFNWSVVSGPPMTPSNFSCNPCANPVASPSATTTYAVVSNLSGTCDNVDTVTVFVVPDFSYNVTQSGTSSCLLQPIQLGIANLTPTAPGYTYNWSPATYLSDPTIANPVATITAPGTYNYTVTVTSPQGCIKTDNVTISVIPAVSPTITATADTSFCAGGTASLGVVFGNGVPAVCGPSATGGCAVSVPIIVGTGTLATNAYPTPFTGFWNNGRIQMLFTAAELNALGFVGGKITSIALDVAQKASTQPYSNFTIKIGCTNLSSLPTTAFQAVGTTVFGPTAVTTTLGINTYNLTTVYEWDGISNLIVEMCYNNTSWTQNDILNKTTTTFASVVNDYEDPSPGCGLPLPDAFVSQFERPNVRFGTCAVAANPANYSYAWTPSSGNIANATAQNTTAQPMTTTTFTVTVTDIAGGCSSTDSVQVDVININALTVTPAGPFCVNGGTQQLAVNVPMSSGAWSGPGVNASTGVFDPATAGNGTHQIIFAVNGACGVGADTISIVVTPQPDATITPVPNQCSTGAAITLTAATAGGTWSGPGITNATAGTFDPATAGVGTHTITYNITTPCTAQDTVLIVVTNQLNATITHVGPFCTTASAVTLAAVSPGGTWSGTGITNPSTGVFDPATAGPGQHVVTYTITGLCGNVDTDTIIVIASPVISFTSDTTEGCEPTTINFVSTVNQPGGTCAWTFGTGATSSTCNPSFEYTTAGSYDVSFSYTNTIGCSSSVTQTGYITIHSQPEAHYSASPQPTTIIDPTVHFSDLSTGVIDSWLWTFDNLGTSTIQNPTYVFPDTGYYLVELIVTNTNGCADTTAGWIGIDPVQVFYAPNAFTPNGNGKNDVFRVYGYGIELSTFEMRIFNRWGEQVFKTNDYFEGWNGAYNNIGDLVQQEVYVWRVTFKDFKGNNKEYIGHVTIVK